MIRILICAVVLPVLLAVVSISPLAAEEGTIPELLLPLVDAQPGEWVVYDFGSGMRSRETILKVGDGMALIRSELYFGDTLTSSAEEEIPLDSHVYVDQTMLDSPDLTVQDVDVPFHGQDMPTQRIEIKGPDGYTRTYLTNEIPVHGLLMIQLNQDVMIQVLEWGFEVPEQ